MMQRSKNLEKWTYIVSTINRCAIIYLFILVIACMVNNIVQYRMKFAQVTQILIK